MLLPVMHMHFVCAWAMAPSLVHGEKSRFTGCGGLESAELPPKVAIDASTTIAAINAFMVAPAIRSWSSDHWRPPAACPEGSGSEVTSPCPLAASFAMMRRA
jgi:hypothetical protein